MNIEELKQNKIVAGSRAMPAVVITLTGGAAAYCIYRGAQELVKKAEYKKNTKRTDFTSTYGINSQYYGLTNGKVICALKASISDVHL